MVNLNYEASKAIITQIAQYLEADFDALGVSPDDFKITHQPVLWRAEQRIRVIRTLEALMFGSAGMLGLARLKLPAEFIAAIVATFVAPCNRKLACYYLEDVSTGGRAEDMAAGLTTENVTAAQLFALVLLLSQEDAATKARQDFALRIGFAVTQSVKP